MSYVPPAAAPPPDPEQKAASTSLGDLLGEVTRDISTLMRQEVELAKAELQQSATRAGKGAGLYGGAGVAGVMTLLFVSIALWWGLGYLIGNAWSALVVAVIWAITGLILYTRAKKAMQSVKGMPKTVDSLKKIPETLTRNDEVQ
ncbi:phage holin family protein [Salinibacterium sp. ZJ454]|uniref:phage holin family protein n=1 Tax=Salinibacterium sp. ZJ454 TaxID=2708339 RepID=UPI00141E3894|nr:phage holin family protein [Salinibacterium sp. ZJ454]